MSQLPKIKFVKLHPDAKMPTTAYDKDVGYDVYAVEDVTIPYGMTKEVNIGLAIECPKDYYFTINTRSVHGKQGKVVHLGIVDPGYRGRITIHFRNVSHNLDNNKGVPFYIKKGDKVAQLLFHKAVYVEFEEVDKLSKTERGEKRHGSSGN